MICDTVGAFETIQKMKVYIRFYFTFTSYTYINNYSENRL